MNMVGTVNEGMLCCWDGCWGVVRIRESGISGKEDNFLVSLGLL